MAKVVGPGYFSGNEKEHDAGGVGKYQGGIKRGNIYMARLPGSMSADKDGTRPVLIIQNNTGNEFSHDVIAACITSSISSRSCPVNVRIPDRLLPKESVVLLSRIMTMGKSRLGEMIARIPPETMDKVDEALRVSLGLPKLE